MTTPSSSSSLAALPKHLTPVDLATVPDLDHQHKQSIVTNGVEDSIVANANTVQVLLAGKLLASLRARIGPERVDLYPDSQLVFPLDSLECSKRRWFKLDGVGGPSHSALTLEV